MKLANLDSPAGWRLAAVAADTVYDLNRAVQLSLSAGRPVTAEARHQADREMPAEMADWLGMGQARRMEAAARALSLAEEVSRETPEDERSKLGIAFPYEHAALAPALPEMASVFAVGLNFPAHVAEAGATASEWPIIFQKPRNSFERHNAVLPFPKASRRIDYEGELAVIIGQRCSCVTEEEALRAVAGYTVANDLSARDWQFRTSEMMIGKAFDGFCPLGPALTTADEVPDPGSLTLTTHVNGEMRQKASLGDMIFSVAHIIAYLSQVMTLQPGDTVLMGTPAGTAISMKPRVWLKPGDMVEVEISSLGKLTARFGADEPEASPDMRKA